MTSYQHDPQYYEAERIVKSLSYNIPTQVPKNTRSGATTGFGANAFDIGLRATFLAPSIIIATDILELSKYFSEIPIDQIKTENIPGNKKCMRIEDAIKKNPDLDHLPMIPLPMKCDKCTYYERCEVTAFLRSDSPHAVGLTHQKLNALMHSSSDIAVAIVDKLMTMTDLVVVDEAHELETSNSSTIRVYPYPDMEKYTQVKDKYPTICEFIDRFNNVINDNDESVIQQFVLHNEKSVEMRMAVQVYDNYGAEKDPETPEFSKTVSAIKDIVEIMKHRDDFGLEVKDVVYLNDLVMTMSGERLVMHYLRDNGKDIVQLSSPGGAQRAFREYIMRCSMNPKCKIIFTSATFGDFYYGNIFGLDINTVVMKDTRNTNAKMTIHPDTMRISTHDYWREEGHANKLRIIEEVKKYADKYPNVRFMCMKIEVAKNLKRWMDKEGYKINIDYYRSTKTLGVSCDDRRLVCVGAPVTAINAFDGVATTYEESQKMRTNANHAAFWQAISRVKDPSGIEESNVYCIGIREDEIRMMCKWGINRTVEMKGVKCLGVKVDRFKEEDGIEPPNIEKILHRRIERTIAKNGEMTRTMIMKKLRLSSGEVVEGLDKLVENGKVFSKISDKKRSPVVYFHSENSIKINAATDSDNVCR